MTSFDLLSAALAPIGIEELREHYQQGKCLVVDGPAEKFDGLVTLADIERRLNDGCNASAFPQLIEQGQRAAMLNSQAPWSPAALAKSEFAQGLAAGKSFMLSNASQVSKGLSRFCDELENCFADQHVHADVHLYVSMSGQGQSYHAHRDRPQHKILLQAEGEAQWQLFEPIAEIPDNVQAISPEEQDSMLQLASEFTLQRGSLLYMPPGTFHRVVAVGGPRISISVPFYGMADAQRMDRSYIPFAGLFEQGLVASASE